MSTDRESKPLIMAQIAGLLALASGSFHRPVSPASKAKKAKTKSWRKGKANAEAKAIAKRRRRNKAARKARKGK